MNLFPFSVLFVELISIFLIFSQFEFFFIDLQLPFFVIHQTWLYSKSQNLNHQIYVLYRNYQWHESDNSLQRLLLGFIEERTKEHCFKNTYEKLGWAPVSDDGSHPHGFILGQSPRQPSLMYGLFLPSKTNNQLPFCLSDHQKLGFFVLLPGSPLSKMISCLSALNDAWDTL